MTAWIKQEPATILRNRYDYRPTFPLRLLDGQHRAGFWSSGWGVLPFSIAESKTALESISVYEITRGVDSYRETMPSLYQVGGSKARTGE